MNSLKLTEEDRIADLSNNNIDGIQSRLVQAIKLLGNKYVITNDRDSELIIRQFIGELFGNKKRSFDEALENAFEEC